MGNHTASQASRPLLRGLPGGQDPSFANSHNSRENNAWPELDEAAYHGLAGDVVRTLEPHTEADPAGLLVVYQAIFGCMVGAKPHARVGGTRHPPKINPLLVGKTSKSRKGTAESTIEAIYEKADAEWMKHHRFGGMASGEGLIEGLNDIPAWSEDGEKQMLVVEPEFSRPLKVGRRDGSVLSDVIRELWDSDRAHILTRNNRRDVRNAHVSIIGHITLEELQRELTATDRVNGFANRFLFVCVKRSKLLPSGGALSEATMERLAKKTKEAVDEAREHGVLTRTPEAEKRWAEIYEELVEDEPGGMVGAIVARSEAQVLRLSVLYALLDGVREIDVAHLNAALAVWDYCNQSARFIFGDSLGDPIADELYRHLLNADAGLDTTQQHRLFGNHVSGRQLEFARALLLEAGLIRTETEGTAGRPREVTYANKAN